VAARYDAERTKEAEEIRQKLDREERERYFNLPHALADYDHWSKAAHWTLDEAIALSFGRAPEIVRWGELQKFSALNSPFVCAICTPTRLGYARGALESTLRPRVAGHFPSLGQKNPHRRSPGIDGCRPKRGTQVADWKSLYDEAVETRKREVAAAETLAANWRGLYDETMAQLQREHSQWLEIANAKDAKFVALEASIASLEQLEPKPANSNGT